MAFTGCGRSTRRINFLSLKRTLHYYNNNNNRYCIISDNGAPRDDLK